MTDTGSGDVKLECANPTVMQVDPFTDVGGNPDPVKTARAQLGKQIHSDDVVERADTAEGSRSCASSGRASWSRSST